VSEIILNDQRSLKDEKIEEFSYGLRPDSTSIGRYRDKNYADLKRLMNPRAGGQIDFMFTGRTVSTIFVKQTRPKAYIFDWNDQHNLLRFGPDILGINQQWWEERQSTDYRLKLIHVINQQYKVY